MIIRLMHAYDLDFAASCTAAEGWASETRAEFEGFLACSRPTVLKLLTPLRELSIIKTTRSGYGFSTKGASFYKRFVTEWKPAWVDCFSAPAKEDQFKGVFY